MSDALLVLNAGSSSLKFSVFLNDDPPRLLLHGQLEGLLTQPRFIARNDTAVVGEKEWPSGTQLGHHGAIEFLFTWGREGAVSEHRIVAVGHRVVHGGVKFTAPVLVDASILAELEALNAKGGPCITRRESRVSAWVIPANEELMIARHTRRLVSRGG
jgi:acetate kinase